MQQYKLKNGLMVPAMGLGTYGISEEMMVSSIQASFTSGATLIDTASAYNNELSIGRAINILSEQKILKREELILQTKVGDKIRDFGLPLGYYFYNSPSCPCHDVKKQVMEQVESSLKSLGTDYLDILLIHWPYYEVLVEIWKCMEELYDQKIVKAIGVSNFKVRHLKKVMAKANYVPMVNQTSISPVNLQAEEYSFCIENNILLQAYSPLYTLKDKEVVNSHPEFFSLADKYGKSISQVLLRWYFQKGIVTIPKSAKAERVTLNADIFDFSISEEDMRVIEAINYNHQYLVESKYCPGY